MEGDPAWVGGRKEGKRRMIRQERGRNKRAAQQGEEVKRQLLLTMWRRGGNRDKSINEFQLNVEMFW